MPKEKAKELVDRYNEISYEFGAFGEQATEEALICIDEIRKSLLIKENVEGFTITGYDAVGQIRDIYWQEVKKEINKL